VRMGVEVAQPARARAERRAMRIMVCLLCVLPSVAGFALSPWSR
jgi:hypothetical protein